MTQVRFLIEKNSESDVFAYFPQMNFNKRLYGNSVKECYAHLGQHSSCHVDYANECREATKEEYNDLKTELESIGYSLTILNKK